jgi:diaminopimelate epimerase
MNAAHIPFAKAHGLRNDYAIVHAADVPTGSAANLALHMCDRHSGVGADGLIVLQERDDAPVLFLIFNADGSAAELCGNGLRCAALCLAENQPASIVLESAVGLHRADVCQDPHGGWLVEMNLVPASSEASLDLELDGVPIELHVICVGNRHAILLSQVSSGIQMLPQLVEAVSQSGRFPDGINVHLGLLREHGMMLYSWERGVGRVHACATGAAAAASALGPGRCEVDMPGGRLSITVPEDGGDIHMGGPAEMICTGVYRYCGVEA